MRDSGAPGDPTLYRRPPLYPTQRDALFHLSRYGLVEASTKAGKTYGCMAWLAEWAHLGPRGEYWWVAPFYGAAMIAKRRLERGLKITARRRDDGYWSITLPNGNVIVFRSAEKPSTLYGEDVRAAVVDEASHVRDDGWTALRTTLTATRGPVRLIGNVRGRRNWFYRLARVAEQGEPNHHYAKLTAYHAVEAGVLSEAEVEDARAQFEKAGKLDEFKELYLAEASDDGGNPFGIAAIHAAIRPLSTGFPVVFGIDLARAVDWTVVIGLDDQGIVCVFERWQHTPWKETKERIASIVGTTPTLVDMTGVGDSIVDDLQRNFGGHFEGFKFSRASKQPLMEALARAIQLGEVGYPEGLISQELESFEYEYTRTGVLYCIIDSMKVLKNDLQWVDAGSLEVGDKVISFDEMPLYGKRQWREATVTAAGRKMLPSYRVHLEDGTSLEASGDHLWLVSLGQGGHTGWRRTSELRGVDPRGRKSPRYTPHRIIKLLEPWEYDATRGAGYLAAAFDGEGSLSKVKPRLSFAQRNNAMLSRVIHELAGRGYRWSIHDSGGSALKLNVLGGVRETMRFLGSIRPQRLALESNPRLGALNAKQSVQVTHIEPLGEREVVAIGTSTKTLIVEGFASHNSPPEGMNDDCVDALALANRQYRARPQWYLGPIRDDERERDDLYE